MYSAKRAPNNLENNLPEGVLKKTWAKRFGMEVKIENERVTNLEKYESRNLPVCVKSATMPLDTVGVN